MIDNYLVGSIVFQVYLGTSIMTNCQNWSLDSTFDEEKDEKPKKKMKFFGRLMV